MKFIDLFAGLGGFHVGFSEQGFECVFASEIDKSLRELYKANHNILPHGDITEIKAEDIPPHDVMCAGFPCQPFSLAGKKKGATCPTSGKLIDDVIRIANYHRPKYILLENVPNVLTIANGTFWEYLVESFHKIGYEIDYKVISPIDIGIPQNRKRLFIMAHSPGEKADVFWKKHETTKPPEFTKLLSKHLEHKVLEEKKYAQLLHWQNLIRHCGLPDKGSFSLVAPEFGATYPENFSSLTLSQIKKFKGAYGQNLSQCNSWEEVLSKLPSYSHKSRAVAQWLKPSIQLSRDFYQANKDYIDKWHKEFNKLNNSWQILEWRGIKGEVELNQHLIQFRASGIRVIKPCIAPSLIAMTPTQIPIVFSEKRYLSKYEAAKLQHLQSLSYLPQNTTKAFKALGNAVNAKVVSMIAQNIKLTLANQL